MRNFNFLKEIHYNQLSRMIHMLEEKVYRKGNVIYKEGDLSDYIYLIGEGQVEI